MTPISCNPCVSRVNGLQPPDRGGQANAPPGVERNTGPEPAILCRKCRNGGAAVGVAHQGGSVQVQAPAKKGNRVQVTT